VSGKGGVGAENGMKGEMGVGGGSGGVEGEKDHSEGGELGVGELWWGRKTGGGMGRGGIGERDEGVERRRGG